MVMLERYIGLSYFEWKILVTSHGRKWAACTEEVPQGRERKVSEVSMLAANALLTVLSLCRKGDALDHDREGRGGLVSGQRKSPVHLVLDLIEECRRKYPDPAQNDKVLL